MEFGRKKFENRHGRRILEQRKSRVKMQLEVELKMPVAYDVPFFAVCREGKGGFSTVELMLGAYRWPEKMVAGNENGREERD